MVLTVLTVLTVLMGLTILRRQFKVIFLRIAVPEGAPVLRIVVLHQRPVRNFVKLKLKRKLWKNSWTRSRSLTLVSQHLWEACNLAAKTV